MDLYTRVSRAWKEIKKRTLLGEVFPCTSLKHSEWAATWSPPNIVFHPIGGNRGPWLSHVLPQKAFFSVQLKFSSALDKSTTMPTSASFVFLLKYSPKRGSIALRMVTEMVLMKFEHLIGREKPSK
jgi:hypothetical protein